MPELPEVEVLRSKLSPKLKGKIIKQIESSESKMILPSLSFCKKELLNAEISRVDRYAKILIIRFSQGKNLLIHLKMTGQLVYVDATGKFIIGGHPILSVGPEFPNRFTRIKIVFSDDTALYFNDPRKFGWMKFAKDAEIEEMIVSDYGLEPIDKKFTLELFSILVKKSKNSQIKDFLTNQKKIAGIGSIYADEACFSANIKPDRKCGTLTTEEIKKLHKSIIENLKKSISLGSTSAISWKNDNWVLGGYEPCVYDRVKEPCNVCGTIIKMVKVKGRGAYFCPKCQL